MLDRMLDPFNDLAQADERFDRVIGRAIPRNAWLPALDVRESEDRYTVTVDLPGMTTDDVWVTFEDGMLTIRGTREFSKEKDEDTFHRIERSYGSFARSVRLPRVTDTEKIEAAFDKGVLTVDVPKSEQARPRTIEVKAT